MTTSDFTTTIIVDKTPAEVFNAVNNVRGWWSEEIDGNTAKLNEEFTYRYKDVHICKMKLVEFIPNEKVVWLVMENYFNFTKDKSEWTGTKISFHITEKEGKTQVRFTHYGLVPAYECFDICSNAWGQYVGQSLRSLITTGKGQPNPIVKIVNEAAAKAAALDYNVSISVSAAAQEVFNAINNIAKWWTEDVEGSSEKLDDVFTVHFGETFITMKVIELVPGKKIAWHVTDCYKHWLKDKKEWNDTQINWDIAVADGATRISFTHIGLIPGIECYNGCEKAWNFYVKESLFKLLTEGNGLPEQK